MKRQSNFVLYILIGIASYLIVSCSAAGYARDLYNQGQDLYVGATKAYSDYVACQTFENQSIEQQMAVVYSYNASVVQQNTEYRAAQRAAAQAGAAAQGAPMVTAPDGTKTVDFNNLPAAANPSNLYSSGLSLSVNALTEATVIPVPPEVSLIAMDSMKVSNQHKFQCAKSWNESAAAYNLWRRQVEGRIVGDLAQRFGIEDMPKELPMFTVQDFSAGAAPNLSNPYMPTAPAKP